MLLGAIFDLDGVLVNSHPLHWQAWRQFLLSIGKQVSDAELAFVLEGAKREEILRHFLGELSPEQIASYGQRKNELVQREEAHLETVEGLQEFLSALEDAAIPKAVATSASRSRTEWMLGKLQLAHRFETIVTGDDVANGKPDPAIFFKAAQYLQLRPKDLLVIEDAVSGVKAAKAAGMKCLAIADGNRASLLWQAGADHVVPDYNGLALPDVERLFAAESSKP